MDPDLASACFGDTEPSASQWRLIRSALHRMDADDVPPALVEQALAATRRPPEPAERAAAASSRAAAAPVRRPPWLRMAAGLLVILTAALIARPLLLDDEPEVASVPPQRSGGQKPNVQPASERPQASTVRQAPFLRATAEVKRVLRAYLAAPSAGRPALVQVLGRHADGVDRIRLDDGLVELLKHNRPFLGVLIDEDASGLVLRATEMPR
jgi:hypothetical protein